MLAFWELCSEKLTSSRVLFCDILVNYYHSLNMTITTIKNIINFKLLHLIIKINLSWTICKLLSKTSLTFFIYKVPITLLTQIENFKRMGGLIKAFTIFLNSQEISTLCRLICWTNFWLFRKIRILSGTFLTIYSREFKYFYKLRKYYQDYFCRKNSKNNQIQFKILSQDATPYKIKNISLH